MSRQVEKREATELEKARANALAYCSFAPGSFAKRFARDLNTQVHSTGAISEKQAATLERMCWAYRRQLPAGLVPSEKPNVLEQA